MPLQRIQQSKSQSPQTLSRPSSQFAPRPFAVQESEDPEASADLESPDFDQDRLEATGLQLKETQGTITPVEQERLGTLQAKMDGVWAQRMERAQAQPSFLDILSRGTQSAQPSELGTPVQAKLTVGQPNDQYEQEADQVAAQVMRMPDTDDEEDPDLQMQPAAPVEDSDEDTLHRQAIADTITPLQRQTIDDSSEDEELQARLQGKTAQAPAVGDNFESQLSGQRGNGQPLPKSLKSSFENKFQAGFDNVRVHTDTASVQMSQAIGAQAFTHGNDIYFNSGKYNPGSSSGQELLAHELTHTIQQTGSKVQTKLSTPASVNRKSNKIHAKRQGANVQLRQAPPEQAESASPGTQPSTSIPAEVPAADPNQAVPESSSSAATPAPTDTASQSTGGNEANTAVPANASTNAAPSQSPDHPAETQVSAPTQPTNQPIAQAPAGGAPLGASTPASPEADPGFQAVVSQSSAVATQQQQHEPAESEAQEAQSAAESPASEIESQAQDQQVGEMAQQEPGTFNAESFKQKILDQLKAVMPTNEEKADKFKESNQVDQVRNSVSTQVCKEQNQAAAPIEAKAEEPPDTSGIEPRQAVPMAPPPPGELPGAIDGSQAAPKPKSEAEVSAPLQTNSQSLDQQMAEVDITEEQLANSNEPQFMDALGAKQEAQTHAETSPAGYRQNEQGILAQSQVDAQSTVDLQTQGMHSQRETLLTQVGGLQDTTKGHDEQKRSEIAGHIHGIYERVKKDVDTSLDGLEGEVTSKFETAANRAKQVFEDYVAQKMDAYKKERYGEWFEVSGWDERISDAWNGLPEKVNEFFVNGRQRYINEMNAPLTDIAHLVANRLDGAKQKIADGRQEIQDYVQSLPQDLQQVGQDAAQNIQSKFDELEQNVDSKQDELVNTITQQYRENLDAIDARIEEMKEANKGLKDKAADAIGGTVQTILQLQSMLEGVLAGAAGAIGNIIKDPIGFLSNLVTGITQGLNSFLGNIWEHMQSGLVGWLTGAMGGMGVQIPDDLFSLPGIFSLVTQVLGLTWDYIRGKAVKMFGEPVVAGMEKGVEIIQVIRERGLEGLWEEIQADFADLKETVIGQIKETVIAQVITAGIKWIISLLNPASAFVKACMAIYNIVMFFVNQGSQVLELVSAVVDAVTSIASGAVGGAAKLIENALVKALPVVIGFLASLLGISGLAKKVQNIITKIRKRIDDAIDKLLNKAKKLFKKKKTEDNKDKDKNNSEKEHVEMGNAAAKALQQKPSGEMTYEELRSLKKKQARDLEDKYNKQLEKPVKMSITFKNPKKDKKNKDLDFHIHIGPNDFEQDYTVLHKVSEGSFKLAPGTLSEHEGGTVLSSTGEEKIVHVYSKHGEGVSEAYLEERLVEELQRFKQLRDERIRRYEEELIPQNEENLERVSQDIERTTNPEKREKKMKQIGEYIDSMQKYLEKANELRGINAKDMNAVRDVLKELGGSLPVMTATKFKDDKILERSILECLKNNQAIINEQLIDEDGKSKPNGTQLKKALKYKLKGNVGIGYKLQGNGNVAKISSSLNFVEVVVAVSDSKNFEYKVLTAFPSS